MLMTPPDYSRLTAEAVTLLEGLVARPSVSRDEGRAADLIEEYLTRHGLHPHRHGHNVWCTSDPDGADTRPTLLLNAHLDTVRPVAGWTRDPFVPTREGDRLYGLGSNDCGGGLVTLLLTYLTLHDKPIPWRLVYLASSEEEVSGREGIESVLPLLPPIDVALVGEPTGLQPAIAEKGLMVLDCVSHGVSGHAARDEGVNALYLAMDDIAWFRTHRYERVSPLLGPVKMSVTMIEAGTQHNVVPDTCRFVVDVRSNECYTNTDLLDEITRHAKCDVKPRSTRLGSSSLSPDHPLVRTLVSLGRTPYGSPTLSDQALIPFPSLKLGPGESARSHTADEYITIGELHEALTLYHTLLCSPVNQ